MKFHLIHEIRDNNYYGVSKSIAEDYITSLVEHIEYVTEAGKKLGILKKQLVCHDDSKWTQAEFVGYSMHFKGGGLPDEFSRAWLHHIHHNPHHWQHWIFPDHYTPKKSQVEDGIVEMPEHFSLEMIADWMGASRAYTGSWNMSDWLIEHIPKIKVHSKTARYLGSILKELGYTDIIKVYDFGSELS